jgi:WD40 repeat protein/DNA-binding SARP family transcriptional activator
MEKLQLSLFGPFQAHLDGEEVSGFKSQKVRALLCFLAVEADRPHSREVLAALLWPDSPEREARNNLRYALYNLRQAILDEIAEPPFLIIEREFLQFNPQSDYCLDVSRFTQLLRRGKGQPVNPEILQEAIQLYTGEYLEGFALPDSLEMDEWITLKRAETHRMLVEALGELADYYENCADYDAALLCARRQIEEEPWQENGHRQLMRLLAYTGQPGAALAYYEQYQQRLHKELGVGPAEETLALADQIRTGSPALQPPGRPTGRKPKTAVKLGECPYRGLAAFRERDAPFFFGRSGYVERLLHALNEQALVVVVVGSSGSGKSSLIFAGLLPAMRSAGDWLVVDFRPGQRPFHNLAAALLPWLDGQISETECLIEAQKLAEAILREEITLQAVIERIREKHPEIKHLLLFSDQFEELYTLCSDAGTQQRFITVLLQTAQSIQGQRSAPLRILLTLRADFMSQALSYRPFADALQHASQMLGPMNRDELRLVVEKPAEIQGACFESGLVERILDDVGEQPGNLPLLEFSLTLLWDQADTRGMLTHAIYEQIGRVEGGLTRYAERVFSELRTQDQSAVRQIFIQLVQPGRGTEDTRRVARREEIGEANWPLVQHLADRRLVVTNLDAGALETVEIVHEALIQRWERLKDWMDADRVFRTWQEILRASIHQWQAADRDEGGLLRGVPLAQAESWLAERGGELSDFEKDFIQASVALREQRQVERQRQQEVELEKARKLAATERRSRRFLGALAGVLALAVLLTAVLAAFANRQRVQALQAYSLSLAASAEQALTDLDTGTALSLALAANHIAGPPRQAQRVLCDAAYAPGARSRLLLKSLVPDYAGAATSLVISPQGDRLLLGLEDGRLVLWEYNGDRVQILAGHSAKITSAAFSPDGRRALSGGEDRQVIYWELATGREILRLGGAALAHSGVVRCVDFSPDGRLALSGGLAGDMITNPGELFLWDLGSGQQIQRFEGHLNGVVDAHFTPDGRKALSSSGDQELLIEGETTEGQTTSNDLILWDVTTGEIQSRYEGLSHDVYDVAISSDGSQALLAAYYDNVISILDLDKGEVTGVLDAHQNAVRSVAYLPGGQRAISASDDASLIVWDLISQTPLAILQAGESSQTALGVLPDGRSALSATGAGEIFRWDLQDAALLRRIGHHEDAIFDVDYSPDGKTALSCAGAGTPNAPARDASLRLWDIQSGRMLQKMEPQVLVNWQCAISPDGRWALSGAYDGSVRLWDLAGGQQIRLLSGHADWVVSLAFAPGGKRALTGSKDGALIYWDLESGEPILRMASDPNANWSLAISPDGRRALSDAARGSAIYWDLESGAEIRRLVRSDSTEAYGASGLAFLPDGQTAISGENDGAVIQWDLRTGQELRRFGKHDDIRTRVEISPDGKRLLTSGMNGVLRLWDLESGELVREFGYSGPAVVFDLALSPDGRTALSGSIDQTITQWSIDYPDLEGLLDWIEANRYVRELTCEERARYQIEPLCTLE